jgi:hypothetical protein|nr:hypothetical protein [Kofleriaceae bacterium]
MSKLAAVALVVAFAGCIEGHEVTATSYASLPQSISEITVTGSFVEAQQRVVEMLMARGFPLVDRRMTANGVLLKFAGNRDFSGASTLGSVFYAWVAPIGPHTARVQMVGKPTVDHLEGCPAMDGKECTPLRTWVRWGIYGTEEAVAIHGVFSELALDGAVPGLPQRTAVK